MLKRIFVACFFIMLFLQPLAGLLASLARAAAPEDTEYGLDPNMPGDAGEWIAGRVNIVNGNMLEVREDFTFPSAHQAGFGFLAFYNSRTTAPGPLGYGWTHRFASKIETFVIVNGVRYFKIVDGTGRSVYFQRTTTRIHPGAFQEPTRLQQEGGFYVWYLLDGSRQGFSWLGRLVWMDDPAGNRLIMSYDFRGRLHTVTDTAGGRMLIFNYNGQGLLSSIRGPVTAAVANGIWVTFGYDAYKNLISVTYADGSGFAYEYAVPSNHNLTRKCNRAGHILGEWSYDGNHRCTSSFEPDGAALSITSLSGTERKITDAYGVVRSYTIATVGENRHVISMSGLSNPPYQPSDAVRWGYDASSFLSEIQYAGGTVTRLQDYDARGNPGTVVLAWGTSVERRIEYTYHPRMKVPLTRTEPSVLPSGNKVTIWDYDNPAAPGDDPNAFNENPTFLLYRIIERGFTRDASGNTVPYETITSFTYNTKGQVLSADGPLPGTSDAVQFVYSPGTFRLQAVTQPLIGTTALGQYDAAGFPGSLTDVNRNLQSFVYDGRARLQEIHYADGSRRMIHYNPAGFIDSQTDEDGVVQTYAYEAVYGRLAQTTDVEGNSLDYSYDTQGHLIEASYRSGGGIQTRLKRWSYEHPTYPGLLWKAIQADGTFAQYDYDSAGNITALTDPLNHTTGFAYDPLNRLTTVTRPDDMTTCYDYDRHGNLSSVTDAEQHRTLYTHDDLGRLIATVSPDTGTTRNAYDEAGNLRWKSDARGVIVEMSYDALNRPTVVDFSARPGLPAYSILYSYDQGSNGRGHLTGVTEPSGTTALTYNARGRHTEKNVTVGSLGFLLVRELSPGGRTQRLIHPGGRTVDFERVNCACRVSRVSTTRDGVTKVIADQMEYRPFGDASGMDLGNGGVVNTRFDLDGRLLEANPGTSKRRSFTYDALGRLKSVTAPNTPWFDRVFEYDAAGRLTETQGPPFGTIYYTHDRVGNRRSETKSGAIESYSYVPGSNRLSSITAPVGTTVFSSDANGNQIGIGTRNLTYNQDNRLIRVEQGGSLLATYSYNALGQRVSKTADGMTTLYLYDFDGNLLAETSGSGTITAEYLHRGRNRLAMVHSATGAVFFFHTDQFGTPQLMTNEANTQVWQADYAPFGEARVNPRSTLVNNFRFQGQYFDEETGFHYNYHRYYDPKTGRYLTPDPIGLAGGINPYVYVQNDPVNEVDPLGLQRPYNEFVPPGTQTLIGGGLSGRGAYGLEYRNPYIGVRAASQYLREMGISRAERVRILQSFEEGTICLREAGVSEFGLRYFSDPSRPAGSYLFETFPASRESLAVQPEWNAMRGFRQYQIRSGGIIIEGRAAGQGPYLLGGQVQKFILDWTSELILP